jgi:lipoprotein NlpI
MLKRIAWILLLPLVIPAPSCSQSNDAQRCSENTASNPDLALHYCTAAIESGRLSEAALAVTFNNRGLAYDNKGDHDRAMQDYDQAIRLKPDYALAFYNRGNACASRGDYDRAIQDFDQAIRLKPDFVEAFTNQGLTYDNKGDHDRAIQDFDQAIRLKPDLAEAFYNRGRAYNHKADYDRAIQDYDQAIRLKPNDADAFTNRGNAYIDKGDHDRAIQDFDQAIRLKPDLAEAFYNRGRAYGRKGDYDRAIQDYDEAIRLKPDDADAFTNRGRAYDDKGDYESAVQDYDQAIRLKPDYAGTILLPRRGLDRFYLAQFTAAQEDFTLLLRNDRTDQYLAIWLYLARARKGQDGSGEMGKNAATLKLTTWPGPVINFYLGKITSSALLQAAHDADPKKDKEQHCEVNFYLGEGSLLRGQQEDAIRYFRDSVATGVTTFPEYMGAKAELKRMQVAQATDGQR